MNLQSIVVVLLRLMALNLVLMVIQMIPMWLVFWPDLLAPSRDEPWEHSWSIVFIALILLASAFLLWMRALPVARLVTRPVSQDVSLGSLSLADCYSIVFVGLGLYQMSVNLAGVLATSQILYVTVVSTSGADWMERIKWDVVFGSFVPFLIGLILFVKGRRWAVKLAARQQLVTPPSPTRDE